MSIKLFEEVNNRFVLAKIFHAENADLFCFLAMSGFQALHEWQLQDEGLTQRKVKRYAIESYNTIIYDEIPADANILEPLTKGLDRTKLSQDDVTNILQKAWRSYVSYEKGALKAYEDIASKLHSNGDISGFSFVMEICKDVRDELNRIQNMLLDYESMGWDSAELSGRQQDLADTYRKKLNKLEIGRELVG